MIILNLKESGSNPRVLGLTSPLFTGCRVEPGSVEAQIKQLEKDLCSKVETASDIVSILRFNAQTKEVLLECQNHHPCELSELLANEMHDLQDFLLDHRYDPTEIYEDNFVEELKDIPDPKKDPFEIINDFLEVLNTMGPWCADKAALVLLVQIEKLKVKTPYERHFLLLCLVSSALLKIRAICDNIFQDLSESEKIYKYSSPKVLRLIEVVRQFKPNKPIESEPNIDSPENQLVSKDDCDNTIKDGITIGCEKKECDNTVISEHSSNCVTPVDSINVASQIPCFICGKHNCSGYSDNDMIKNDSSSNNLSSNDQDNCITNNSDLIPSENGDVYNQKIVENFSDITNKNNSDLCSNTSDVEENHNNEIEKFSGSSEIYNNQVLSQVPNTINEGIVSKMGRWRGRGRGWRQRRGGGNQGKIFKPQINDDPDSLCGIIFVENRFTAKILYHLFHDLHKNDPDFENISTQYTVGKIADPIADPREAEIEHRKQEDVLKRFRLRECNLVIATSVLEEGIDLPKCNLIVRYDPVPNYKSHAYSKGRAKHQFSYYISIIEEDMIDKYLKIYAQYICTEKLLLKRISTPEASDQEESEANAYTNAIPPYKPLENCPGVNMASSIMLVNKYCAKLPSDTFTRLTPTWSIGEVLFEGKLMYYCTVRLPINSPVKQDIVGHPMPSKVLSRRIAALETCRLLHERGELDDNLEPIGKESFNAGFEEEDLPPISWDPNLPRPGTTKSRQYYYKRIANCLNNCRPVVGVDCYFYNIDMVLTCPLPEEQNTRGRKLHPPELASQAFGILTLKEIPKVCPFPIFTRSGEVQVSLKLCSSSINLSERHVETIATFLNFNFTSVLRLQKYLMSFDPQAKENSFFIVPTKKDDNGISQVDWDFLEVIYKRRDESPHSISDEERKGFAFDPEKYNDAVVMPWYRNQDQPQYFYVAEICYHLNPKSGFPGSFYKTFEDYYLKKYGIQIQNTAQPLLDVDHTSARLNFLTPRYVNRKGVALPTSSEETKRAKRENLEQKQILVGELCEVHVVPASLWRQAVCLPCILYRLNALLLADEIRTKVAEEIGLGLITLTKDFEWAPLDFGWSLADVLKKTNKEIENKEAIIVKEIVDKGEDVEAKENLLDDDKSKIVVKKKEGSDTDDSDDDTNKDSANEDDKDKGDWMEIGTWSNDMAQLGDEFQKDLPPELSMVRYGSPTSWNVGENQSFNYYSSDCESDDSSEIYLESETSDSSDGGAGKLKITFRGDYLAEAIEENEPELKQENEHIKKLDLEVWTWDTEDLIPDVKESIDIETKEFQKQTEQQMEIIKSQNKLIKKEEQFIIIKEDEKKQGIIPGEMKDFDFKVSSYSMPSGIIAKSSNKKFLHYHYPAETIINEEIEDDITFSFDHQPELEGHPGPSPSILLQALTMSNANDGINLERLETIGDSFLKYAITTYLYCTNENIHEGKLSHLRSKQVSNLKLYRLGQKKVFGESMIASKFEPHDNWLPPCYLVPRDAEQKLLDSEPQATLPYNLVTQHSIPDKSIADCVEALIGQAIKDLGLGAYLIECGPRGALLFMSWLGIKVLPKEEINTTTQSSLVQLIGSIKADENTVVNFTSLSEPVSPLLRHVDDPEGELAYLLSGFEALESSLHYSFRDKSYLLQAMSHASYSPNRVTDCYQRLEFLGDAVLVGEEAEDVEVPKALGDVFESIAGAIFLDSGMSLDTVWKVYYRMMKKEIEQFSTKVPKSPIRELKPEKLADGRRVRVTVEVFGKGTFKGIGRNYRIAKCTAAKCALKQLKIGLLARKLTEHPSQS
ncbi:Putative dicer-1 [Halyomorpha halys]|nr:Putative dicer-1 [Halyomorpha halys]